MKIKKLIIGCVIIGCILLCIIFMISKKQSYKDNLSGTIETSNEATEEVIDEEGNEGVSLTISNATGKTINEVYFYGNEKDESENMIGVCVLDEPLSDGEYREITIDNYDEDIQWDITAVIDDNELEMDYTVGSDFIYDGSVIIFGLQDNQLMIIDEDDELEENQDNIELENKVEDNITKTE